MHLTERSNENIFLVQYIRKHFIHYNKFCLKQLKTIPMSYEI